ncbi:Cytoplasmic dynein 1 light intermediate chain 2 [Nymphon striatum]|nr:Cytoplasmic dynein 1 light intermediate chain 2 [Nymphon striatum]
MFCYRTKILSQVQSSSDNKLPANKSVLVLGNPESGKTTLIAKLQGNEDPKRGTGLEYFYLNVRDEYRDDHTRLGVWILDGDAFHKNLLKFALSEKSIKNSLIMLVVPMNQPWHIMESLDNWAAVLQEHINRLKLSPDDANEQQQHFVKKFQSYTEPGDELDSGATSPMKRTADGFSKPISNINPSTIGSPGEVEDALLLPLGENTLTNNLGIDIIVVVTKTDHMTVLEKEHDYKDEHFDFIQQQIRKFCLSYGATLCYTSVKEDKNCDLLYKYLVHRIYGLPFSTSALVVEKDSVFIPSGWDNEKKISILYENMTNMKPDDVYTDVILRPITRKPIQREAEVQAEDEQMFLMRQQALYNQQAPSPMKQVSIVVSQKRKVPENGDVSRKAARCSAQQVAAILDSDDEETLGFDKDYPSDELETDSDDNVDNDNDSENDSDNENPVDRLPEDLLLGIILILETIMRSPAGVQKSGDRRMSSPGQGNMSSPKKIDGTKGVAGTNEGVLANFFNSLLNKKPGANPAAAGMKSAGNQHKNGCVSEDPLGLDRASVQLAPYSSLFDTLGVCIVSRSAEDIVLSCLTWTNKAVRNDAAAELDRMTRPKKPVPINAQAEESNHDAS